MSRSSALAPLRARNFAWYYSATTVNLLGTTMAGIALTFGVLGLTGSTTSLGLVMAARTTPMVVLLLWGGVIADRFSRTAIIQVGNLMSGLTQALVAVLFLTGSAQLWQIVVLSAVNGAVSALTFPALRSVLPQLVARDQLQPTNALMSISRNGLTVLGPSLGALLVVTIGSGWALAFDAATWLVSAALLTRVRIPPRERDAAGPGTLQQLREGWTYFRGTTWLWVVVVAFGVLNAIGSGAWMVIGPSVAKHTIGAQGWGLVLSAEAVGLLATALALLRVRLRRPLFAGMIGISVLGLPMVMLGARPALVPLVGIALLAGAGTEIFGIGWNLAMQEHVPEAMLSRAYSYDALGSFVAIPIGQVVAGPVALAVGAPTVLVSAGVAYIAICGLVLACRPVRSLGRSDAAEQPEVAAR